MEYTEPEKDFPIELFRLSVVDLRQMARFHHRIADTCLKRAQRLQGIDLMKRAAQEKVDALEASYRVVLAYLDRGYNSIESAVSAAARELNLSELTVMGWWKLFLKNRDRAAREERDALIINLVKTGHRNYEIARRLGVHTNTVSRAISGYLFPGMRPVDRARLRKRRKATASSSPAGRTLPGPPGTCSPP